MTEGLWIRRFKLVQETVIASDERGWGRLGKGGASEWRPVAVGTLSKVGKRREGAELRWEAARASFPHVWSICLSAEEQIMAIWVTQPMALWELRGR